MNDLSKQSKVFDECLREDGPVAIIIKQYLRPVEGHGEVIFPPTYPMPTYKGRVHTIRDGEYRVSVELPPYRQDSSGSDKKNEKDAKDEPGYNIDEFKNGMNICEIDSPQSQANRLEPLFKTIKDGSLVPQITIKVGDEPVNLLDAGHRAADAVVRLSSMAADYHKAFVEVRKGNHLELAQLAPTSLLFGVWDSRGTQVKLPRIIKAEIRAEKVQLQTRSAQFNPAIDYVAAGGIDETLDKGKGENNPLSAEGMKHVPAPRSVGGVRVLGVITRVIRINLVALRDLQAFSDNKIDPIKTKQLCKYVLGLALIAATYPLKLNLREGCLLCQDKSKPGSKQLVYIDGEEKPFDCDLLAVEMYAEEASKVFFGEKYTNKDKEAVFESGVANKYLGMSADDRKKLARSGPITEDALRKFDEKGRDPLKSLSDALKEAKEKLPKKTGGKKAATPIKDPECFNTVKERLTELYDDVNADHVVIQFVEEVMELIDNDEDTHQTIKVVDDKIKAFNKNRKASLAASTGVKSSEDIKV